MKDKPRDSIGVGKRNAKILEDWIRKIPLQEVPINQFNCANRAKILKSLGIQGSKDQVAIKNAFAKLDEKLTGDPQTTRRAKGNGEDVKLYKRRIAELEHRLTLVTNELATYKRHDKLIEHLINTGTLLK
ncbi:MAG: hypothetical protein ABW082_11595 [Sedimenticola sp.]